MLYGNRMFMKKLSYFSVSFLVFWVVSFYLIAQAPANYYQDRTGKRGEIWQNVLSKVICKVGNGSNFYF